MRIIAEKCKALTLKPGDLFGGADQQAVDQILADKNCVGIKVHLRTSNPTPIDDWQTDTHKYVVHTDADTPDESKDDYARRIALQAFGLFFADQRPDEVLPSDAIVIAIDTILDKTNKHKQD